LRIASHIDFPKVRTFLESVARGSKNSKASYEIGLKHLQCFLNSISNNNNNNSANDYSSYDIETILLALQSNKVNVYELLDSFVSYLVNMPHQPPIAPTSNWKDRLKIVIDTMDSIAKDKNVSLADRLKSESIKVEALAILRVAFESSISSPDPHSALEKIVEKSSRR
jgi:hypothetical protein